ncbi:MAG: Chromosomal replication initiator protein DnaA, partial [Candidatus Gottesmanbacteria bacterium GW2011_GWA1_48_13]
LFGIEMILSAPARQDLSRAGNFEAFGIGFVGFDTHGDILFGPFDDNRESFRPAFRSAGDAVAHGDEFEQAVKAPTRRVSAGEVLEAVASEFGIKTTALKGPKRDRPIARPRQVFMYLCRIELGLTLDDIGGSVGGRDHTTILHGVETITRELSTNLRLLESVEGIKQKLFHLST